MLALRRCLTYLHLFCEWNLHTTISLSCLLWPCPKSLWPFLATRSLALKSAVDLISKHYFASAWPFHSNSRPFSNMPKFPESRRILSWISALADNGTYHDTRSHADFFFAWKAISSFIGRCVFDVTGHGASSSRRKSARQEKEEGGSRLGSSRKRGQCRSKEDETHRYLFPDRIGRMLSLSSN